MFEDFLPGARNLLDTLKTPEGKRALTAFGIQLMQPLPFGQSPIGQIGQGIGAAMDTYDAAKTAEAGQAQKLFEDQIKQQNADVQKAKAESSGGLSFKDLFRQKNTETKQRASFYDKYAQNIFKNTDLAGKNKDPEYDGLTPDQIRDKLLSDPQKKSEMDRQYDQLYGNTPGTPTTPAASAQGTQSATSGPDNVAPAAPDTSLTDKLANPPGSAAAEGVTAPTGNRTFANWTKQFPDRWDNIRVGLYSSDPNQKAWATQQILRLKGVVVDPDSVDRQLAKDRG